MAFSESFLDELLSRTDIVELASQYVKLTRRGSNYFGLCPFHSEKTPSFSVSPDKQIYHCFGCGAGGYAINFVMQAENVDFPDAVRILAKRAGLQLEEDADDKQRQQRERILALNKAAARFFYDTLATPEGALAAAYAEKRGLTREIIIRFGIGAAADGWDRLLNAMRAKNFHEGDLIDAGLARRNEKGRVYDYFRNRLMFPIINVRGEIIGFGGRALDDSAVKYLNTPETLVFNKSKNLFALNLVKKSKQGRIILAEGYMDVATLHQAGFDCAVASLGTSLTDAQARLIAYYARDREAVIAYDSDQAGVAAAQRAIGLLNKAGVNVKVLRYTGAKDPDEYIKLRGKEAFELLLNGSEGQAAYRLSVIQAKYDLNIDEQRVAFVKEAARMLCALENPVEREIYAVRAAQAARVSNEAMALEVKKAFRARISKDKNEEKKQTPARTAQPVQRELKYSDVASAKAEEGVLAILLDAPELIKAAGEKLSETDFSAPFLGRLYSVLQERNRNKQGVSPGALAQLFTGNEMAQIIRLSKKPQDAQNNQKALEDQIATIRERAITRLAKADDESLLKLAQDKRKQVSGG